MNRLARVLDGEFRRVAQQEGIEMAELIADVAREIGCSTRQLYNYRSGKWPLPATAIPTLCRRFASYALLDALRDECHLEDEIAVPDSYDLTRLVAQTVRDDMRYYERFLNAFESDGIDFNELEELRASGERIIQNVRQFEAIAAADCHRRAHRSNRSK